MPYGGTNWGWQADPNVVYTSMTTAPRSVRRGDSPKRCRSSSSWVNPAVRAWVKENPDTRSRFDSVRHAGNGTAATDDTTSFTVDVPDGVYTASVRVDGHDFKILPAGYDLERQRLVYSTSEIYTHMRAGDRDVALLHGRRGEAGETVLRYAREPRVKVVAGDVEAAFDPARGDLRLNYVHDGLARVLISGGGRPPLTAARRQRHRLDVLARGHRARSAARARRVPGAQRALARARRWPWMATRRPGAVGGIRRAGAFGDLERPAAARVDGAGAACGASAGARAVEVCARGAGGAAGFR